MGIKPVQNQFNGGEISPLMDARFDLAVYQYAAAVMKNNIPASEGYFKRRGGTHFVASAKETDALLFQIVSNVDGAEIWINNIEQDFCYCAPGDTVSYTVSAEGYASKSGVCRVIKNTELTVNLVSNTIKYRFAIEVMPADAVVIINGLERKSAVVGAGSRVEWSVAKDGYKTQSGIVEGISEDKLLIINLKMRFSVIASPSDAIVVINDEERSFIDVDPGTVVNWSVSKEGFEAQSGSQTVTKTIDIIVSLSSQVPGQIMFESSTAGNYNIRLEAGRYELIMCGAGGNGWSVGLPGNNWNWNGGSGAVFDGIVNIPTDNYQIQVGQTFINTSGSVSPVSAACIFDRFITAEGGYGGCPSGTSTVGVGNNGGALSINKPEAVESSTIASNGKNGIFLASDSGLGIVPAPLSDEYKNSYGFGGKSTTSGRGVLGGDSYIRLVYLGK